MESNDLYGLPLDQFVRARGELARALRREGQREEAESVGALRRPSVAAWAVNQLVRTQSPAVTELFEAGDELREAHHEVISGRSHGGSLTAAVQREREAVESLVSRARGLLSSEGHEVSAATIERVADTLHAAALNLDARATVREGRLQHELRYVGIGDPQAGDAPPARRRPARKPPVKENQAQRSERAREKAREATEAEARRKAERAARALRAAQERRERAAQALREADQKLARARAEAEAAARGLG